ncbi:hypothetical protein Nmel_004099 [Mimus melanotis]
MLKLKVLKRKEEGTDRFHESHQKRWDRYVIELVKGECQFIPSHLAAVAKTGQFSKFLHFQENFVANHELLPNYLTAEY